MTSEYIYYVEAESPLSDDPVVFETERESKALSWLVIRDATVRDADGRLLDGETLWDRFGETPTKQTTLTAATDGGNDKSSER